MKSWGKIIVIVGLVTTFAACGDHSPSASSELSSLKSSNPTVSSIKVPATAKKSNVLAIGGQSEPFGSIAANLGSFDPKDKKKNLSMIWSLLDQDFKQDFDNEAFFTVVNRVDPKTKTVSLGSYFGLDTSVAALSKRGNELSFESMDATSYSMMLGDQTIAMSWNGKENRFVPSIKEGATTAKKASDIELKRDGKKIIETTLPLFNISDENFEKLTHLTLDLSKDGYTDDHIAVESEEDLNCSILAGWQKEEGYQTVTFKLNFQNGELDFSNFEAEKLSMVKDIVFNEKYATTLMCTKLSPKNDTNPYNTFVISAIPVYLKVIQSEIAPIAKVETPVVNTKETPAEITEENPVVIDSDDAITETVTAPAAKNNATVVTKTKNTRVVASNTTKANSTVAKNTSSRRERKKAAKLNLQATTTTNKTDSVVTTITIPATTNSTPVVVAKPEGKKTYDGVPLQLNHVDNDMPIANAGTNAFPTN